MSNGWSPRSIEIARTYSGVQTNNPISAEFPITAGGSRNMVLKITTSAATVVGTVTVKLQSAIGSDWVDMKSTTIASAGSVYLRLNIEVAGDQSVLPMLAKGRVVLTTTNAGDSITLSGIQVLQEL